MISDVAYRIIGRIDENVYEAECRDSREDRKYIFGLSGAAIGSLNVTAELTDIITDGADEETDEALRERFYEKVRNPATSGNKHHYRQWALEVPGVGDAKVFPLDSGDGTLTVMIVDVDKARNPSLEPAVRDYIETVRPIGATVTVSESDNEVCQCVKRM